MTQPSSTHTARAGGYARMTGRVTGARRPAPAVGTTPLTTAGTSAPIPAQDSTIFLPERTLPGDPRRLDGAWRRLPELRLDPADPAAAGLFAASGAEPEQRASLLAATARAQPTSAEARLRWADALIMGGSAEVETMMRPLDEALGIDRFDWRPDWYCGKMYMALNRAAEAIECFDKVYNEIPGETAPKLALAMALETDNRPVEAAGYGGHDNITAIAMRWTC